MVGRERALREITQTRDHPDDQQARTPLRMALPILSEVMPIPAAVLLFTEGAAGIHHAFRVHRPILEIEGTHEARKVLAEVHDRIDRLDPNRAGVLVELADAGVPPMTCHVLPNCRGCVLLARGRWGPQRTNKASVSHDLRARCSASSAAIQRNPNRHNACYLLDCR